MGKIIAISGVSGSGKTTLMEHLLSLGPQCQMIQSATSRKRRTRDREGEFLYLSDTEFSKKKASGEFLWTTLVHGTHYGTLQSTVSSALETNRIFIMVITAPYIKTLVDTIGESAGRNVLGFYILSPGETTLRERLRSRGDASTDIEQRIEGCKGWDNEAIKLGINYPIQYLKNDRIVELFLINADERLARFLKTR